MPMAAKMTPKRAGPMPNSSRRAKNSAGRPNCTIDVADCERSARTRIVVRCDTT
jgi:hypothetical protein